MAPNPGTFKAMVAFGRKHPEVGEAFDAYLKEIARLEKLPFAGNTRMVWSRRSLVQ